MVWNKITLQYFIMFQLYDTLRSKKPNFASRIVPVEGDVADMRVGLADKDWDNITNEVLLELQFLKLLENNHVKYIQTSHRLSGD